MSPGVKSKMARSLTGCNRDGRRVIRNEFAVFEIELKNQHLVQTEIGNINAFVIRRNIRRMGVRTLLPLRIDTTALVLNKIRRFAQRAVFPNGQHTGATPTVICHHSIAPRCIDIQMAGTSALCRLPVDKREFCGFRINRKRANRPRTFAIVFTDLIDRIEKSPIGMNGEKCRILTLDTISRGEFAGFGIEPVNVNTFAASAGISANTGNDIAHGKSPLMTQNIDDHIAKITGRENIFGIGCFRGEFRSRITPFENIEHSVPQSV